MRRALDVDDVVALLVSDVVLLGDPEHLLAQQEDVPVEQGIRLDLHRHTGAGHPILTPALRAFDELPGELILELVRRSTLTSHAYRHGRPPDGARRRTKWARGKLTARGRRRLDLRRPLP